MKRTRMLSVIAVVMAGVMLISGAAADNLKPTTTGKADNTLTRSQVSSTGHPAFRLA